MASAPAVLATVVVERSSQRHPDRQGRVDCSRSRHGRPHQDLEKVFDGPVLFWEIVSSRWCPTGRAQCLRGARAGLHGIEPALLAGWGLLKLALRDRLLTQVSPTTLPPFWKLCAGQWMGRASQFSTSPTPGGTAR